MARIHLWADRVLSVARLGRVGLHAHAATAVLFAVDGPFGLRVAGGRFEAVEHVVLSAGCPHELDCGEGRVGVVHLAPGALAHAQVCAHLGLDPDVSHHRLEPPPRRREELDAIFEGELGGAELAAWMDARVGASVRRHARDRRVEAVAQRLASAQENEPLDELAAGVGLSASRLQHLFRAELGITPRQLRTWQRLQAVARRVSEGDDLTRAALEAGFVDSAHSSHAFRRFLGIAPSRVLSRQARVHVHAPKST